MLLVAYVASCAGAVMFASAGALLPAVAFVSIAVWFVAAASI